MEYSASLCLCIHSTAQLLLLNHEYVIYNDQTDLPLSFWWTVLMQHMSVSVVVDKSCAQIPLAMIWWTLTWLLL